MSSAKHAFPRRTLLSGALLATSSCAQPSPQDVAECEQWVEWRAAPTSFDELVNLSEGLLIGTALGVSKERVAQGEAFLVDFATDETRGHAIAEDGKSSIYFPHLGSDRCDMSAFGGLPFSIGKKYAVFVETSSSYAINQTVAFGPTGVLEVDGSSIRTPDRSALKGDLPGSAGDLLSLVDY